MRTPKKRTEKNKDEFLRSQNQKRYADLTCSVAQLCHENANEYLTVNSVHGAEWAAVAL
jgi:hypothetical protein